MTSLEVIGRFGEGMKLAALALLRQNKTFRIKTAANWQERRCYAVAT